MTLASGGQKIEARHLTKRYASTLAVDDLSFEVNPGMGINHIHSSELALELDCFGKVVLGAAVMREHKPGKHQYEKERQCQGHNSFAPEFMPEGATSIYAPRVRVRLPVDFTTFEEYTRDMLVNSLHNA